MTRHWHESTDEQPGVGLLLVLVSWVVSIVLMLAMSSWITGWPIG